jgi:predicted ATP-grasp superfamily ATP-dependent carboligase
MDWYRYRRGKGHDVIIRVIRERTVPVSLNYDKDSEPHGLFLQRKIRNCPEQFGIGSLAESCADPGIVHTGTKFMKDLGYHGIGVVEMKKDPRDGLYKVLEVNARPWTQLWLVTCSGMNLPYMAYCDAIGEQMEKVAGYREGLKWLCMSDDLLTRQPAKRLAQHRRIYRLAMGTAVWLAWT